jgi:glucosyl-dolichyl phosphate glucuronosyltransferase
MTPREHHPSGGPPTGRPSLCVILPTRNRRDELGAALKAVLPQLSEDDELIVANDGSEDGTADFAESLVSPSGGKARLLDLPHRGPSETRNLAAKETTADVLCLLDDDAVASPSWLEDLRQLWLEADGSVAVIGGRIIPDWQGGEPPWFRDYLGYVVSALDLGPKRLVLDQGPGGFVWGANMSLRRSAFVSVGGFDAALGATPARPWARGEEEELQRRLALAGWQVVYDPRLVVEHRVGAERSTAASFRTAFRNSGLVAVHDGASRISALPILLRASARYAVLRALRRPSAPTAVFTLVRGWTILTAARTSPEERKRSA